MDKVVLNKWIGDDKPLTEMNKQWFMGTMIADLGKLNGYIVQIMFPQLAIPTKKIISYEDAKKIKDEIWEAFEC